ncbi:MAG: hypothetical protein EA397_03015 [Deltaproteobacteria bacterium]|nr:MAG: hypothetical protein EA397_03015 [Deltaproteobacteria bacterium]
MRTPVLFLTALALVACNDDWDGDGLTNQEERELGTDPRNPDTDGDGLTDGMEVLVHNSDPLSPDTDNNGFLDGEEVDGGYDPTDPLSYPRGNDGRWPDLSSYASATTAEGWAIGERAPDMQVVDQFGQTVRLEQFYGNVILINLSAGWCQPCRNAAVQNEERYRRLADDGFLFFSYMIDDNRQTGSVDDENFLAAWADQYGMTSPVIAEPGNQTQAAMLQARVWNGGVPGYILLDQEMRVDSFGHPVQLMSRAEILLSSSQ